MLLPSTEHIDDERAGDCVFVMPCRPWLRVRPSNAANLSTASRRRLPAPAGRTQSPLLHARRGSIITGPVLLLLLLLLLVGQRLLCMDVIDRFSSAGALNRVV